MRAVTCGEFFSGGFVENFLVDPSPRRYRADKIAVMPRASAGPRALSARERAGGSKIMATPDLENGGSGSNLEPAAFSNPSKPSRAMRRRRSRSWAQFDLERRLRPVVQVRPTEELTPRGGVFEGESGSGGGGPEREETASVGASPRHSYSHRRWFPFFGRKSSIPPPAMGRKEAVGRGGGPAAARPADKAGASWTWRNNPADGASAIREAADDDNAHSGGAGGESEQHGEVMMILTPPPGPGFVGTAAAAAAAGARETPAPGPKAALTSEEGERRQPGAVGGKGAARLLVSDGQSEASTPPPASGGGADDDPGSTQGRRKDRQGVSLRRGASKTTAPRSASMTLEPGTQVLCLDILAAADGGDEIRRWRPAVVSWTTVGVWPALRPQQYSSSVAGGRYATSLPAWYSSSSGCTFDFCSSGAVA